MKSRFTILIIIFSLLFIFSMYKIIIWINANNITKNETELINKDIIINEIKEENKQTNNEETLIDVDFNQLKRTNKYVKGWLQVKGTKINYPFVQYTDNKYYLTHSFENKKSEAGWIFMDYRNNSNDLNDNTIIYGHNRLNKSMFGSLKDTLKKNWLNNKENHIIKLSTENENTLWQVFSIYKINTTSDYLKIEFKSDKQKNSFIKMITNRSYYNFKINVNSNDKILTLSTCNGGKQKLVLHAKLIKSQNK